METSDKKEIELSLGEIMRNIGIDRPSNFVEILQFVIEDIDETAHPIDWNSSDVSIAFRRWMESNSKNQT